MHTIYFLQPYINCCVLLLTTDAPNPISICEQILAVA
jgi:hypothetical protein